MNTHLFTMKLVLLVVVLVVVKAKLYPVFDVTPHLQTFEWDPTEQLRGVRLYDASHQLWLSRDVCVWCSGYTHYPQFSQHSVVLTPVPEWLCQDRVYDVKVEVVTTKRNATWMWHSGNTSLCPEGLHPLTPETLAALNYSPQAEAPVVALALEYLVIPGFCIYLLVVCVIKRYESSSRQSAQ